MWNILFTWIFTKKSIEMDNIHYDWHIKDGNRVNKQILLINNVVLIEEVENIVWSADIWNL